ncbi:uncharacterized protein DC041_0004193 [Schistosoma bovis]|uniref:Uncharacterized protein n=1 Tax=Schistosoma bovis TaxID=6184 RepID=A0A430QBS9_SCHBO|nr:uncharacterized protein DC041_0004193 [Schistosoma bovis]
MESSTAFSLCVILHDAVKEFKILANVVDIMRKKYFEVNYRNLGASFQDMHMKVLKELQKSSKITEYPSTATVVEDSFFSTKYMEKLMKEIFCLIDVLEKLAEEIQNTGSCDSLQQSVDKEESEFKDIEHILERERQAREKIKEMRHKIQEKNEDGIKTIEQGKETIAYLKDQVQEMKAKIIMEEKYITRYSAVKLEEFQSQCDQKENEIKHQLDFVQSNRNTEERVHAEITSYLNDRISYLRKHEKFWKEKSDKDITQFKQELNELKDKKEKNLTKLSELSLLYKEYEAVVLSDRIEKEKARQREEQEELELFAACKLSSLVSINDDNVLAYFK